jgi:hypothetical protein
MAKFDDKPDCGAIGILPEKEPHNHRSGSICRHPKDRSMRLIGALPGISA